MLQGLSVFYWVYQVCKQMICSYSPVPRTSTGVFIDDVISLANPAIAELPYHVLHKVVRSTDDIQDLFIQKRTFAQGFFTQLDGTYGNVVELQNSYSYISNGGGQTEHEFYLSAISKINSIVNTKREQEVTRRTARNIGFFTHVAELTIGSMFDSTQLVAFIFSYVSDDNTY